MQRLLSYWREPMTWIAFALVFLAIPGGYQYMFAIEASIVWPAVGFVFAFLLVDWRRYFLPTLLGVFFGYFFSLVVFFNYGTLDLIGRAVIFTGSLHLPAFFGALYLGKRLDKNVITRTNLIRFLLVVLIVAFFNAVPANLYLFLTGAMNGAALWTSFSIWFLGNFFAMIIFGFSLWAALLLDEKPAKNLMFARELAFYAFFILMAMLVFSETLGFINYANHKFLFFPLAIVVAFYLPHRAYIIGTMLYLSFMVWFPPVDAQMNLFYYLFDVNLFLVLILITILSLKWVLWYIEQEKTALDLTNDRLNQLIGSMETLFNLSTEITTLDDVESDRQVAGVFRMIFNLFERFDYGACLVVENGNVRYIDTVGYDIDFLNKFSYDVSKWITKLERPRHFENAEANIKREMGSMYEEYAKRNPAMKESVLMSVQLSESLVCEMSFDLAENSTRRISDNVMHYFESLNILLNSFYESKMMASENDESKNSMIQALLKTVGLYNKDAEQHAEDVADIAVALAKAFNLDKSVVNELYWAGIVHDIGMIGVDSHVVNKKGVYTQDEYEQMKAHVIHGANILRQTSHLKKIAALVRHHHEHHNGLGYPDGLKGDEILLETSILALSEVVAAMVRNYPYAKQKTLDDVVVELKDKSGSQFHPLVVDKMVELIEAGLLTSFYDKDKTRR